MDAVTDATFEREVVGSELPIVVEFWAPWCKPCKAIEPILEALADEHAGSIRFVRVNLDDNPGWASRYGVLSLPTVLVFSGGELRDTIFGARPRGHFDRALEPLLRS